MGFITKVTYIDLGKEIKAVVHCGVASRAVTFIGDRCYHEMHNDKEPFDFGTHCFMLDKEELTNAGAISVCITSNENGEKTTEKDIFDINELISYKEAVISTDRGLKLESSKQEAVCEGVEYSIENYKTVKGEPVVAYIFKYDPAVCEFQCGTPNGTYEYKDQKQTVMAEAEYAAGQGKEVLGAFNADFFDMFHDCAPSGLCVKDGKVVANPDSKRYFFGMKKNGEHIIESLSENPDLLSEFQEAVSGRDLLLCGGDVCDVAVGEPFGYTPHPRTAAGICADGKVIIAVVDGRRPRHSNGASLYDLALLLKSHGAMRALNLDGGGSSTFIVKKDGKLEMLNHPADLFRPDEDLIRDVFNSILIVATPNTLEHA